MTISLDRSSGNYKVIDFISDHSHPLHLSCCAHMMSSQRKITEAHIIQMDLADDSRINPKKTHELMGKQAGGRDNLGHTRLDHRNYLRGKRQNNLQYGEAESLLRYFQQQTLENQAFFYRVQLDKEEQITNIFWADPKMITDYAHFGDVVTFDTTLDTNNEYRPFGVFVGFNHHRESVIFGAALLYDETIPSFEWLFETFLEAHNQKNPQTIFTDQDAAMANALCSKMPRTRHGLCVWHIMHNCSTHLGNLAKGGNDILRDFKSCMFDCEEVTEFDDKWQSLLAKHDVYVNPWLQRIHGLREKWARPYMKTTFSIGMRSTQLSESLNASMKDYLRSNLDLPRFFHHFERSVNDKRYKELEAEYNCRQKLPRIKMKKSPMLNQAAQVYTSNIFDLFQEEYDEFQGAFVRSKDESKPTSEYIIAIVGKDREYKVLSNQVYKTVSCECRKFETLGILCSYAMKVLDAMDIKLIPEEYIIKRWTRDARSGVVQDLRGTVTENVSKLEICERYHVLCPRYVKMISRAAECEEAYAFLANELPKLSNTVEDICKNFSTTFNGGVDKNDQTINTSLQNAKGLKKKTGCKGVITGKRRRSWVDNQSNKRTINANKKRAKHVPRAIPPTTTRNDVFNVSHENGMSQRGMTAITPTTRNNNVYNISPENGISQVVNQSYFVDSHNGEGLYRPEYHQSYMDLLWNGVRADNQVVGDSQKYPNLN